MSEISVKNCYNAGDVFSNTNGASGIMSGINYGCVENCYNTAKITGSKYSSGIVDLLGGTAVVQLCFNSGKIVGGSSNRGGIIGSIVSINGDILDEDILEMVIGCFYARETANGGFGWINANNRNESNVDLDGAAEVMEEGSMPTVLEVINGDNEFVEDTENINNGNPILKWQVE